MDKSKRKIINWKQYNQALVNRGSFALWSDDGVVSNWHCDEHHGGRGRGFEYSDVSIVTVFMLKGLFGLSLQATEGFINSLFELMGLPLKSPDYSCISKRAKSVTVKYRNPSQRFHSPLGC